MSAPAAEPIRILYVARLAFAHWRFLDGQNAYLRARGFEIHAAAAPDRWLDRVTARDGAVCHPVRISPRAVAPFADLLALVQLFHIIRRVRPHVVHVSTPKAALLGAVAAWAARVPVRLFLARGSSTTDARGLRRRLYRLLERATARLCTDTACVSPSLLAHLRAEGVLRPDEGWVAARGTSNGVRAVRFARPADAPEVGPVVGYVGRLAAGKGIETLAAAWARVREAHPGARLLLVGRWDDDHPVDPALRRALETAPRVECTGHVDDPAPALHRMAVAAFPSPAEGFPNAPLEAAAAGLPVVGMRTVGMVDAVVDGVTGALVPVGDAEALADAILRYLRDPALAREHGRAGCLRVARDFAPEPVWAAMHARYLALLGAAPAAAMGGEDASALTPMLP